MKKLTIFLCSCLLGSVLQAQIIHVPADYPTIQQGIQAANPGDTVLVADDTYYEQINFLGKPITVASEFIIDGDQGHIDNTILDGSQISNPDSGSIVYFISGEDTTSVLCGFTLRNGNIGTAAAYPTGGYLQSGGAVYIFESGAKIMNNHITQNNLNGVGFKTTGAGISAGQWWEDAHWVVIDHNTIDYNSCYSDHQQAFGAGICVTCNTRIINNVISDNVIHGSASATGAAAGIFAGGELYWPSLAAVVINNKIKNNVAVSESNYGGGAGATFQCNSVIFQGNIVEDNEVNSASSSGGGVLFWAPRTGSIFSGNTFQYNITDGSGGGLYLEYVSTNVGSDTVMVENNYFNDNSAKTGGGFTTKNNPAVLQNNVFTLNHGTISGGGIYVSGNNLDHLAILVNNSFYQNSAGSLGGAIYSYRGRPVIINSIFWKDTANTGPEIWLTGVDSAEIAYTDIDMSLIYGGTTIDGGGNINVDPLFEDMELLTLASWSPCVNSGTEEYTCQCGQYYHCPLYDINGNPRPMDGLFDMGAYEVHLSNVIHIPADYPTIQQGIDAALPEDLVLVSDGTYYEQINFLGKAITVASEFIIDGDQGHIDNTIIDGSQIPAGDSSSVVYFINGEDTTSVLCGFTIQGGHGTLWEYGRQGGGICCLSGASILNNIIQDNQVIVTENGAHGGGILVNSPLPVHILNNTIRHNQVDCQSAGQNAGAGGAILAVYSSAFRHTISGNLIEENEARTSSSYLALGGGIFLQEVSVVCENNIFKNNISQHTLSNGANGGAIHWWICLEGSCIRNNSFITNKSEQYGGAISLYAPDSAELIIENNYFEGDSSKTGGALCTWNSKLLIQNNVFNSNQASNSGGACYLEHDVLSQEHKSVLINNSFYNNHASSGGAIISARTKPLILNSIFWNDTANAGPEIYMSGGDSVEIAYTDIDMSLISGGTIIDGGGNIPGSDPLFMSPDFLMLSGISPCIDQGTDTYTCNHGITYNCPEYDILNTPRPMDEGFDMGAYEWYLGVGIEEEQSAVGGQQSAVTVYPNPTSGISHFAFRISQCQRVTLKLYDLHGREVATVAEGYMAAGEHLINLDLQDLPAGIYYYRLTTDDYRLTTGTGKLVKF